TNLLTITSVSCENFPSKTLRDWDHLTGGDMSRRISVLAALLLIVPARQQAQQPLAPVDWKQVDAGLGESGALQPDGAYQVGVPRAEEITADGIDVPTSMGLATAINFQPTGGGKAAITGDFVLIGNEVNPVIRALRDNGIAITALHSHMLTDSPHLFFMHYWANDDALKLAHGLRAALDKMNVKKV